MPEFLGQVEVGKLLGQGDVVDIENVGFRKRSDERRAGEEGVQKGASDSHREGAMVSPGALPGKLINSFPERTKWLGFGDKNLTGCKGNCGRRWFRI